MTAVRQGAPRRGKAWANWGRAEGITPQFMAAPTTVDEVQAAIRFGRERGLPVKAIGAGHSFTAISVAPGVQLDLAGIDGLLEVDAARGLARIAAGTNLYQLPALLEPHGLALENMGDIDRQTMAGATSTGTHGTGARFRGLAAQVVALTLVTADGTILTISETENAHLLPAAKLGLGALGIIVDLTVQCVPTFLLRAVEKPEPLASVIEAFDERVAAVDHFEFYWFPHTTTVLTKTNTRMPADAPRRPLGRAGRWVDDTLMANGLFALTCAVARATPVLTPGINRLATWLSGNREFTDISTSVFVSPRRVRFREMEYALPREAVPAALADIRRLISDRGWRISFPIEVRAAAADDLWLSTAQGRESGYIAVHRYWREDHHEYFAAVEKILLSYAGRPHWGKIHTLGATMLAELYSHHEDFVALRNRLDPDRVFTNPYLDRVLGP